MYFVTHEATRKQPARSSRAGTAVVPIVSFYHQTWKLHTTPAQHMGELYESQPNKTGAVFFYQTEHMEATMSTQQNKWGAVWIPPKHMGAVPIQHIFHLQPYSWNQESSQKGNNELTGVSLRVVSETGLGGGSFFPSTVTIGILHIEGVTWGGGEGRRG